MEKEVRKNTVNNGDKRKPINKKINTNNAERLNVKVDPREGTESVLDLYNTKIKKIHIITMIIVIILFVLYFVISFSQTRQVSHLTTSTMTEQLNNTLAYSCVTILAGIVPYFYLSFGGVAQLMPLISDFGARYTLGKSFAVSIFVGGIINCIGIALCMAIGFYYCYLTTKKRKYYNASQFSMDDVKLQFYEMRNQKDKIEELNKKRAKKAEEIESCNVKIPYLKLCALGLVAYVIQIIGILIAKI